MEEAKFKIGDQWFYRGNRSNVWLAVASRPDGSCQDGICDRVPSVCWPFLEEIVRLKLIPDNRIAAPKVAGSTPAPMGDSEVPALDGAHTTDAKVPVGGPSVAAFPPAGYALVPLEPPPSIPAQGYDDVLFQHCRDDDYQGLYREMVKRAAVYTGAEPCGDGGV